MTPQRVLKTCSFVVDSTPFFINQSQNSQTTSFVGWWCNSDPNFGALETAQQSKGIPEGNLPGQSGTSIVGSFLSHARKADFSSYIFHELAGFNMV
jgi:hypothetical protein